jgi:hypothetical protein
MAKIAAALIHFTGYEKSIASIRVPGPVYRLIGNLPGSADFIARMADRCYLAKCRGHVYHELVAGGLARRREPDLSALRRLRSVTLKAFSAPV